MYPNVRFNPSTTSFEYRLNVGGHVLVETGFPNGAAAAWACDVARYVLKAHIRRVRPYNFPERIKLISETEPISDAVTNLLNRLTAESPEVAPDSVDAAAIRERIVQLTGRINEAVDFCAQVAAISSRLDALLSTYRDRLSSPNALLKLRERLDKDASEANERGILDDAARTELTVHLDTLVKPVDLSKELVENDGLDENTPSRAEARD